MTTDTRPTQLAPAPGAGATTTDLPEALLRCFQEQRFADLAALYADDAAFELSVGTYHERRTGPAEIAERYRADFSAGATFLRWQVRPAPWGAAVEAEALQPEGGALLRYRWVHLLSIDAGRITRDAVYCTGGVPEPPATAG